MIALEDKCNDILGKARRGLGLSFSELAKFTGFSESHLKDWESGRSLPDDKKLGRLSKILRLVPDRLIESAHQKWYPEQSSTNRIKNLMQISSPYGDMIVNSYLVWNISTHEAALFDTGTSFQLLQQNVTSYPLTLKYLFITHTHTDHIALLDQIYQMWRPEIFTSKREYVRDAKVISQKDSFHLGKIDIEVLETEGHSPGGLTYVLKYLGDRTPRVAVVGDAMFAGSVGGPMYSYETLLNNLRQKVISLPDDTILAPGHGPFTTVGEEKKHNPFFA